MSSFEQRLEQVTELISLPEIYLKIRHLMEDPTSEIDDFAEVIRIDPSLSVAVLKLVNSAFFGFSGQIDSISRAVNMIGIGQLHNMVLGISSISALSFPNDIWPLRAFWRSSLFSGVLSRLLAEKLSIKQNDRLFVIGLLHEIGHLVLYARFPEEARLTIQTAQDNGLEIHSAEQKVLGCHYGQIGAKLMAQWQLSNEFQLMTRYQPTPGKASDLPVETAILHIAHGHAHRQFGDGENSLDELIDPVVWEMTQISQQQVEESLEAARTISADMESVLLR
jgi:HD-like signal output (HDOD) protein